MLWLTWHMWILLLLAFLGGVVTGWVLHGRSDHTPAPQPKGLIEPKSAAPVVNVTPAPETTPEPAPEPVTAEPAAAAAEPTANAATADDLTVIKGLGPKAAEKLAAEGVTRLGQIAAWTEADIERFDALINGRGRIGRDDWVGQAKALTA